MLNRVGSRSGDEDAGRLSEAWVRLARKFTPSAKWSFCPTHQVDVREREQFRIKGNFLGVMPRKSGENFIITSDRVAGELPSHRVPKKTPSDVFQVWTGQEWSASITDATFFTAIDVADEYIRANFARVMS